MAPTRIDAWAGRDVKTKAPSVDASWFVGVEVEVVDGAQRLAGATHHLTPDEAEAFADKLREEARRARHHEFAERRRAT